MNRGVGVVRDRDEKFVSGNGWIRKLDMSPHTRHWTVEFYVPQDPHEEPPLVFGYG